VSRWYRAYEGTVTDAKLGEVALIAEVSRSVAIAAWHCLLESAASKNNCGSHETNCRRVAVILGEPVASIDKLFAAFDEIGMTSNGAIAAWKKRQFQSDDSKERVRKHREKKRQETADVTVGNGDVTPPYTETDTKTEEASSNEDSPSADEPSLTVDEVFEGYQSLAAELGLPVPRDLTPERRQLLRGRIKQYSMDDFQTVFAKCRDSPFLRGDKNGRTPLAFDWLFKKGNFQKALEGNYSD
jgi:hypothetical protein